MITLNRIQPIKIFRYLLLLFSLALISYSLFCASPSKNLVITPTIPPQVLQKLNQDSSGLVIGIDISRHQGTINWDNVRDHKVQFAYIKATEGRTLIDQKFSENYRASREAGIATGAYHFFLFNRPGREQADHFIKNVPHSPGDLPPAVDIEIYSNNRGNNSDRTIISGIQVFINKVYNHYGMWPVIYTDNATYRRFIKGRFFECPLWICDLKKEVQLEDKRSWLIWQYAHTGKVRGIAGNVDMNVFRGTFKDFISYLTKGKNN